MSNSLHFRHGPALRFMTGGGGDKTVAGYTGRVLAVTEVDGLDKSSATSREADRLKQLEARTLAYADQARIYLECTASIEEGRIWQEYTGSTASRLELPCPHCGAFVLPERSELSGWQDAATAGEARRLAAWHCPGCGEAWTDEERETANRSARLVHTGETKDQTTLGFRWSAVHNLFWSAGFLGEKEWKAQREENADNAEREMCQFFWARPWSPPRFDVAPLTRDGLLARMQGTRQGIVPDDTDFLTVGVDVGKWVVHYLAIAWVTDGSGRIVDYGTQRAPSDQMDTQQAVHLALTHLRDDLLTHGYGLAGGGTFTPDQVWIDSRYQTDAIFAFATESDPQLYRPMQGYGSGQQRLGYYRPPTKTNNTVHWIGDGYHFSWVPEAALHRVDVSGDLWKTRATERLQLPLDAAGAISLYQTLPRQHLGLVRQLTAEEPLEEFVPGRGLIQRWYQKARANHYFDCLYIACAAGHFCGVRLLDEPERDASEPVPAGPRPSPVTSPDGRPFHVLGRH